MANVKIVTDSSAQLTDDEISKYGITVVPLTVMIDNTVYVERDTINNETFVPKMLAAKDLPKTSQPPVGKFVETFNKLGEDGSQILCLNMLEAISGTIHAAEQAATISTSDVTVVDSQSTDRGLAFQVLEAAELAQQGADMQTILNKITKVRENTRLYLCVMTLDNIVKGGRLHPVAGAITNFLNIKLGLQVTGGKLKIVSKGRGDKSLRKFFGRILEDMKNTPALKKIGISYVTETNVLKETMTKLKEEFPDVPLLYRVTSPIISTHTGEGAFALIYYSDPD
ncbi:DegV family protein [Lentilactobacillus hilgardii]|uniref:EDD domain protein, DegV family n=1 Tax=Lentilactobacillus hilgardii (strain ATCC 8290 / DSM 20176 / CCUG 30140 / JCM 1155 / KCTC 3500 / NBRC 15886 / NCIMB 8040 / NRRL B-1843 / 9) TaxID=1423757 RepID=C0XLT6_LENH9|nr:DegV family protein [Lentilactobacillus hilgardii]EEI18515.1 EDD domain protein, DegV family [Lentilactobacillus buchneri ATCC 11577]EEI23656.1 EDD domain protein, DegV family [Lentilactobacillus hilgardii DSM 20176 = ATCC 8290]MCP9332214.1 DegV family protein [Lentilactobacillus hilgardii]MCP9348844.1 DegV family protein [Lentilactobacillus hilgardii]MCP9351577.1 DegV family protein [Lentilactobacillus hilgardii]